MTGSAFLLLPRQTFLTDDRNFMHSSRSLNAGKSRATNVLFPTDKCFCRRISLSRVSNIRERSPSLQSA